MTYLYASDLPFKNFILDIWPVSGLPVVKNKLTSVFYAFLLLLKINFVITLSKFSIYHQNLDLHTLLYANDLLVRVRLVFQKLFIPDI